MPNEGANGEAMKEAIEHRKLTASRIASQIVRPNWAKAHTKPFEGEGECIAAIENGIIEVLLGQLEQHDKNLSAARLAGREEMRMEAMEAVKETPCQNESDDGGSCVCCVATMKTINSLT